MGENKREPANISLSSDSRIALDLKRAQAAHKSLRTRSGYIDFFITRIMPYIPDDIDPTAFDTDIWQRILNNDKFSITGPTTITQIPLKTEIPPIKTNINSEIQTEIPPIKTAVPQRKAQEQDIQIKAPEPKTAPKISLATMSHSF